MLAFFEHQQHAVVSFRRTQAVDAAYAGDDHAIAPLEQRARGRKAETVELFVDGGFFFDVDAARRNEGFGLVVVVIADEIFDGVRGKEGLEFVIQLRGEGLVMRQHQRRTAQLAR